MNNEVELEIKSRVEDDGNGFVIFTDGLNKNNKPELELRKIPEEFIENAKSIVNSVKEYVAQTATIQNGEIIELKDKMNNCRFVLRIVQLPSLTQEDSIPNLRIVDYYEEQEEIPLGIPRVIIETYLLEGIRYLNNEKYREALIFFDKCILLKPDYKYAYKFRGETNLYLKMPHKAVDDFTRALEFGDTDSSIYFNRGIAFAFEDDVINALKDITKFIDLNPENPIGFQQRAIINEKFGNVSDALKDKKTADSL